MAGKLDEEVYFIPLTSCDFYGRPSYPTALFDMFSKAQMKKHNIITMTVQDLANEYKTSNVSFDESNDFFPTSNNYSKDRELRKVFEDAANKAVSGKMGPLEFRQIMGNNGINAQNACEEMQYGMLNATTEQYKVDVYNLLFCFIRQKRRQGKKFHIFLDEFPEEYSK